VNDLQEELSRARIEDEDGTVDWLGCQVTLKGLGKGLKFTFVREINASL